MDGESILLNSIPDGVARTSVGESNVYLILEVAYLLATVDGKIRDSEIVEFRNTARLFLGPRYNTPDTIEFFMTVQDKSRRLLDVLKFYSDDEGKINAFNRCSDEAVKGICTSSASIIRRAFAFWIGMCNSDNDYAEIERKAVESLRQKVILSVPTMSEFLSDQFMSALEKHIVAVKSFEHEVMDNPSISDIEKDNRLRKMIEDFDVLVRTE